MNERSIETSHEWRDWLSGIGASQIVVLTDANTHRHCYQYFKTQYLSTFPHHVFTLAAGENHKTLSAAEDIWGNLLTIGADKKTLLIALGGGVICDLGAFTAAAFKRGIAHAHVPTTHLAMVDAALGGKSAVNYGGYKNQLGFFHPAQAILTDVAFLKTLPEREAELGAAETLKHAAIADADFWQKLKQVNLSEIASSAAIIKQSALVKKNIVATDLRDSGPRQLLNFGHTTGHAIEALALEQNQPMHHGEAVALGCQIEAHIAAQMGLLNPAEAAEVANQFSRISTTLPPNLRAPESLWRFALSDKKNENGEVVFTLLKAIGQGVIGQRPSFEQFSIALNHAARG